MNERIKELAEQCMVDKQVPCKQPDGWTSLETVRMIDPEKFAELIVEECALTLESITVPVSGLYQDFDNGYNKALWTGSTVIKKHFGVEE